MKEMGIPFRLEDDNKFVYYTLMILILTGLLSEFFSIMQQLIRSIFCSKKGNLVKIEDANQKFAQAKFGVPESKHS